MRKVLPALFLLLPLAAGAASAQEAGRAELLVEAAASRTCAPWDGAAISLKITTRTSAATPEQATHLIIDLWRDGLNKTTAGGEISFSADYGMDGDGRLEVCTGTPSINNMCKPTAGRLVLKKADGADQPLQGDIFWTPAGTTSTLTVPFTAPWKNSGPQFCG